MATGSESSEGDPVEPVLLIEHEGHPKHIQPPPASHRYQPRGAHRRGEAEGAPRASKSYKRLVIAIGCAVPRRGKHEGATLWSQPVCGRSGASREPRPHHRGAERRQPRGDAESGRRKAVARRGPKGRGRAGRQHVVDPGLGLGAHRDAVCLGPVIISLGHQEEWANHPNAYEGDADSAHITRLRPWL